MDKIRAEGIVLHSFSFGDYDQILTVFTRDHGLVKLIMKGGRSRKKGLFSLLEPLACGEFVFQVGKGDLYACREASPVELHLPLRQTLHTLQQGCQLLQALQRSQMPGRAAPELYELVRRYLERMGSADKPEVLVSSFLLKILRHEGLLHITNRCAVCEEPLERRVIVGGEVFCQKHAPFQTWELGPEEAELLAVLAVSRSLGELTELVVEEEMHRQIGLLFESLVR